MKKLHAIFVFMKFCGTSTITTFIACIFLMLTLAWLTVSLPIVYAAQQVIENTSPTDTDEGVDRNNPLTNTTEEKSPNTVIEEYLHDSNLSDKYLSIVSIRHQVEDEANYDSFCGELISPPPDFS